jgi:hypothetical protein
MCPKYSTSLLAKRHFCILIFKPASSSKVKTFSRLNVMKQKIGIVKVTAFSKGKLLSHGSMLEINTGIKAMS